MSRRHNTDSMSHSSTAPRLTTMLRAFLTEDGAPIDVAAGMLVREEAVLRRQRQRETDTPSYPQLTWKLVSDDVSGTSSNERAQMREVYGQFLRLLSEHIRSSLNQVAMEVYHALSQNDSDSLPTQRKTQCIQGLPGNTIHQLSKLTDKLSAWRASHGAAACPAAPGSLLPEEYGADLDIKYAIQPSFFDCFALGGEDKPMDIFGSASGDQQRGAVHVDPLIVAQPGPSSGSLLPDHHLWPSGNALNVSSDTNPQTATSGALLTVADVYQRCERFLEGADLSIQPQLGVEDLTASIMSLVLSNRRDEEIQGGLIELLGFEDAALTFVSDLLKDRQSLLRVLQGGEAKDRGGPAVAPGANFQARSEDAMSADRARRKEARRERRRGKHAEQSVSEQRQWLQEAGVSLSGAEQMPDGIHDLLPAGTTSDGVSPDRRALLPEGSVIHDDNVREEVNIPPERPTPQVTAAPLVSTTEAFGDVSRMAFRGIPTLNRVQSRVYECAYHTNQNMLVCAPTGSGKTNVALMAVLHEVEQHLKRGVINVDEFKIIYVAPMKALAAEIVRTFAQRLAPLNLVVKELTGDMQLTRHEISKTQMIVTTPEKWDVITRKSGDAALTQMVKLLIIDEVHLLENDRGSVLESLVARTLRQVEATQSMIRIVGLSATLPNYRDVARFLGVSEAGLFYFDGKYRPVPLQQSYIGVKGKSAFEVVNSTNRICFQKVVETLKHGHQVMVFVHSRKDTVKTARTLAEMAHDEGREELFESEISRRHEYVMRELKKSRNKDVKDLADVGLGIHHAGMLRSDRTVSERLFSEGLIKVLCCTATLAWGVNLPAHTVLIKGTKVYNAEKGGFVELSMLDVMQIFGRAGRPQFDTSGEGIIITTHDQLWHYVKLMNHQLPIESHFIERLHDNLNAEVVLGTVTTIQEAVVWLSYTYLYVRMLHNPLIYGVTWRDREEDPALEAKRMELVINSAQHLDQAEMVTYHEASGSLMPTDLGRTASYFYIMRDTITHYQEKWREVMTDAELLDMVAGSVEFEQIKVRDEEMDELEWLVQESCNVAVKGGPTSRVGKVNILLQAFISRSRVKEFSLVSDMMYVNQNAARIFRALFEIAMKKQWTAMAERALAYSKMTDWRLWDTSHPLSQFPQLPQDIVRKLSSGGSRMVAAAAPGRGKSSARQMATTIEAMADMTDRELGQLAGHVRMGSQLAQCVRQFPRLTVEALIAPITRTVLRVTLELHADFEWSDRAHGMSLPWWIWVEDPENLHVYHSEYFVLRKRARNDVHKLSFTVPIFEPLPPQYHIRVVSDLWLGADATVPLSFRHMILPERHPPHTELLDLRPLPVTVLKNPQHQRLFTFSHFNPIQTQTFHILLHSDHNVLMGAPTGSGKTVLAELAMLRVFNTTPQSKIVYIAPLKALVRERVLDWRKRFRHMNKRIVELTGDVTPDVRVLNTADVVITTPEKWDGISRAWHRRGYVRQTALMIIDEIHLLGGDRGAVLEVIVSRMRYISAQTDRALRFVGLSTALANARDLADWLGIDKVGLFNFRPSVRPVPLEVHIQGYHGKHYCPRMATMNKPTYMAITMHSPDRPTLVFVASRRQTRLTALDMISLCSAEENPRRFLHMPTEEMEVITKGIRDTALKHTLLFGIGLHHAGLCQKDKNVVEDLFGHQKIQVLVSTATLAWGINLPAHLVVVKGTEFYDAATHRYVDFPITDVLQMMGRAGRPQYDDQGVAVILVHEPKKSFYRKFLYEPFPVESALPGQLHDHINAEIVSGTIASRHDVIEYLTWTYFYRRLGQNPSYYDVAVDEEMPRQQLLDTLDPKLEQAMNVRLDHLVDEVLVDLEAAGCIAIQDGDAPIFQNPNDEGKDEEESGVEISPLTMGRIASFYYLHYTTIAALPRPELGGIGPDSNVQALLFTLCEAHEFSELPVRHNEDVMNEELAGHLPWPATRHGSASYDKPATKAHLLLQAHLAHVPLPISDYITDLKSVLDQTVRVINAMVDVSAEMGWLWACLNSIHLLQMVTQARFLTEPTVLCLESITPVVERALFATGIECLPQLMEWSVPQLSQALQKSWTRFGLDQGKGGSPRSLAAEIVAVARKLPKIGVRLQVNPSIARSQTGNSDADSGVGDVDDRSGSGLTLSIRVELTRLNPNTGATKVYAPRFPKPTQESWWVVIGDTQTGELLGIRRAAVRADGMPSITTVEGILPLLSPQRKDQSTAALTRDWVFHTGASLPDPKPSFSNAESLQFARGTKPPDSPTHTPHVIDIGLFSGSYLGLDQQYHLCWAR